MKFILLFILSYLFIPISFSQQTNEPQTIDRGIDLFKLGDSITKFKGALGCADYQKSDLKINLDDSLPCFSFWFLPAKKQPVIVADVKFTDVIIFPDVHKRLKIVTYLKDYLKTDSVKPKEAAKHDYKSLLSYISKQVRQKPKDYEPDFYNHTFSEIGKIWKKKDIVFTLRETKIKRKDVNLSYTLEFTYAFKE